MFVCNRGELQGNPVIITGPIIITGRSHLCICKVEKERLSPTTPASVMITLALIGAWHNSLDRMPAVILVSPLLKVFFLSILGHKFFQQCKSETKKPNKVKHCLSLMHFGQFICFVKYFIP